MVDNTKFLKDIQKGQSEAMAKALRQSSKMTGLNTKPHAIPAKIIIPFLDFTASSVKKELEKSFNFYTEKELEPLKSTVKIQTSRAKSLSSKLRTCPAGPSNWRKYEQVCIEILSFCLVPPLAPPLEQVETRDKLHKRDLIFQIPHELGDFWTYIITRFGLALIFEFKNYKNAIKENQLVISQKYIGKKKISRLGLIVTRKGLHANAQMAQEKIWNESAKMLLCLSDEDLNMMLQLKEDHDKPWKVIDNKIRKFLVSLS